MTTCKIIMGAAYFGFWMFFGSAFAGNAIARTWESDLVKAKSALEEKRCDEAWDLMWYWARQGHTDANAMISAALLVYGIYPPNLPNPAKKWKAVWLYFVMNGYDKKFPVDPDMVVDLLKSHRVRQPHGTRIAECIVEKPNVECREMAVKFNLIPSREDFVNNVENTLGTPVQCWPQTDIFLKTPR